MKSSFGVGWRDRCCRCGRFGGWGWCSGCFGGGWFGNSRNITGDDVQLLSDRRFGFRFHNVSCDGFASEKVDVPSDAGGVVLEVAAHNFVSQIEFTASSAYYQGLNESA